MSAQYNGLNKLISKKPQAKIIFKSSEFQQFGFDEYRFTEWSNHYDSLENDRLKEYQISYKSVGFNLPDNVDAVFLNKKNFYSDSVSFSIEERNQTIRFAQKNDSTFTLFLPKMTTNYTVSAWYKGVKYGALNVVVYGLKTENVIIVPLVNTRLYKDSIEQQLNAIYQQANIQFNISIQPVFRHKDFNSKDLFDNPSPDNDRFSNQMREFRDAYFDSHPNANKRANYVFIIPGFVDPNLKGYMVLGKAIAFVKVTDNNEMNLTIARELGRDIGILKNSWKDFGPKKGTTDNLMDESGGINLAHFQWENLRHSNHSFSFYDNYEDVRTNNGIVAYYFWKEDKNGNIILEKNDLLESIKRPYKKNFMSYHLNIGDFFFQTLFKVGDYLICLWHIIAFVLIFVLSFIVRRRFHRYIKLKFRRKPFLKFASRMGIFLSACVLFALAFLFINKGYDRFEVRAGLLKDLKMQTTKKAIKAILINRNVKHKTKNQLCSEVLINRGKNWYVKQRKKVLYFNVSQDENKQWSLCRFSKDSDSLSLKKLNFNEKAESHYFVVNYIGKGGRYEDQKVYNHLGVDISSKLKIEDPVKRILVFVNGYRPTSLGQTFEENFNDIQTKGLEYDNSSNMIYNFDRYDYWKPWQAIDVLFQKRINPSETYYADGHFSVSTSNYESLINFTSVSSIYPKRCPNKKHHTCYSTTINSSGRFGSKTVKTTDLLRTEPNKKGFRERVENGRIAARNLLQLFNEMPNKSSNDTIYIVAHSMGYAYSIGMIEVLRGRINFGGFYIIAPENASVGKVNLNEWKEVWQYGSNFNYAKGDAPCLQDGVAPQTLVGGLTPKYRTYIPTHLYKNKGFFDSHFIGYYTWIFSIDKGKSGYIIQR